MIKTQLGFFNPVFAGTEVVNKNNLTTVKNAFKELSQKFAEIPEIGKFKPIKVNLQNPIQGSKIKNATIVIEPSIKPDDYRTRVLTFITKSPIDENITHEMSPASGNKFCIESTLKNPKLIRVLENFIKEAEDILT